MASLFVPRPEPATIEALCEYQLAKYWLVFRKNNSRESLRPTPTIFSKDLCV